MMTSKGLHTSAESWSSAIVVAWAHALAARFDVGNPRGALQRIGVKLHVRSDRLRTTKRCIHGVWDPLLRRIELHGCDQQRRDQELVETLGHEIWHLTTQVRNTIARKNAGAEPDDHIADETAATLFAAEWRKCLGAARVRRCAAALRGLIENRNDHEASNTYSLPHWDANL